MLSCVRRVSASSPCNPPEIWRVSPLYTPESAKSAVAEVRGDSVIGICKEKKRVRLTSLKCTHPPAPPPPAPPWSLAPPAPSEPPLLFPRPLIIPPPRLTPPGLANAWAAARRSSSACAWAARTSLRMPRKRPFSRNDRGVGGSSVVVPTASPGLGGSVGR